jgi:hypothetical protein
MHKLVLLAQAKHTKHTGFEMASVYILQCGFRVVDSSGNTVSNLSQKEIGLFLLAQASHSGYHGFSGLLVTAFVLIGKLAFGAVGLF